MEKENRLTLQLSISRDEMNGLLVLLDEETISREAWDSVVPDSPIAVDLSDEALKPYIGESGGRLRILTATLGFALLADKFDAADDKSNEDDERD